MNLRAFTRSVATTVVAAAFAAASAGCSGGPETPEALFDEMVARYSAGQHGATWDLVSSEGRRRYAAEVEKIRTTIRRNPGAAKLASQFSMSVEEFLSLPYDEIWSRAYAGSERALQGAKLLRVEPDVREPDVMVVEFETAFGQRFRWYVHEDGNRGWRLRDASPLKLE